MKDIYLRKAINVLKAKMSQFRNQSNSFSNGRSGSNNRGIDKKFCKVCHDAGKSTRKESPEFFTQWAYGGGGVVHSAPACAGW
jgi:protein gp37